jgi:hypothetical protein
MATGNLLVQLTDTAGQAVPGRIQIDLDPLSGDPGTGGDQMETSVTGSFTELLITGIACRGGLGTTYRALASTPHYRPYAFLQLIQEDRDNTANDDVEFWVEPGDVTNIDAPSFGDLPAHVRGMLENASMVAERPEDRDLLGTSGDDLYRRMGPLRKACLLNIVRKASDGPTAADCLPFVEGLLLCRQDRFFATVKPGLPEHLANSPVYNTAPKVLHQPLPGYEKSVHPSMKSRDAHANIQVTFMRHATTGDLAADIDIDESAGIKHGFEVIRNALFRNRTNPYLIREFLIAADPITRRLDPGYAFVF